MEKYIHFKTIVHYKAPGVAVSCPGGVVHQSSQGHGAGSGGSGGNGWPAGVGGVEDRSLHWVNTQPLGITRCQTSFSGNDIVKLLLQDS